MVQLLQAWGLLTLLASGRANLEVGEEAVFIKVCVRVSHCSEVLRMWTLTTSTCRPAPEGGCGEGGEEARVGVALEGGTEHGELMGRVLEVGEIATKY